MFIGVVGDRQRVGVRNTGKRQNSSRMFGTKNSFLDTEYSFSQTTPGKRKNTTTSSSTYTNTLPHTQTDCFSQEDEKTLYLESNDYPSACMTDLDSAILLSSEAGRTNVPTAQKNDNANTSYNAWGSHNYKNNIVSDIVGQEAKRALNFDDFDNPEKMINYSKEDADDTGNNQANTANTMSLFRRHSSESVPFKYDFERANNNNSNGPQQRKRSKSTTSSIGTNLQLPPSRETLCQSKGVNVKKSHYNFNERATPSPGTYPAQYPPNM